MAFTPLRRSLVSTNDVLLVCDSMTDTLLERIRTVSARGRVAVASRSSDDRWLPAAFAAGASACAVGIAETDDLEAFVASVARLT